MITNIVVHPKGATHKDNIGYFVKELTDGWYFWCDHTKQWFKECLVVVKYFPIR